MTAPPLLALTDIHLGLGTTPLLTGAALSVAPGERLALVGRNGSGKSTLLRVAAGLLEGDRGRRFVQPGARLHYLPQAPDLDGFATVGAYVEAGLPAGGGAHLATRAMDALGVAAEADPAQLSGGEARRAALARALAADPDILLLDEPTNHLDLPAIALLEATLAASRAALVLISHDRRFLEALSRATLWLDRGVTRRLDQGFAAFEPWRDALLEAEAAERHKLDRKIAREEDWMRYGVTARRKRNVRRVGELAALRQRRREALRPTGAARMAVAEGAGAGTLVIEAEGLAKSFGDRPIVRDVSTRVLRGDRLGIVGANGAGKTTLLRLLTGELAPDAGRVRLGTGLVPVRLDQLRDGVDPAVTVAAALTEGRGDQVWVDGKPRHVAGYLRDFLFHPDQAGTPVGVLSGGERARLLLARAFAVPSTLMLLDEPTNDLDLETLDLLEGLLAEYGGTVLAVSHDRDFLDRVCTGVIVAEGEGRWTEYAGGYADMVAQRGRGVEAPAPAPGKAAVPRPARIQAPAATAALSGAELHALRTLPARIEALGAEIAQLGRALADPALYARDRGRFDRFTAALAERQAELAAAEERWLELELRREAAC